ncbi:MAG: S9 family peptidase [Planctomycetota bacterium]|nr:MAG: S9 family peptidase [Planctomycetota bacterium]
MSIPLVALILAVPQSAAPAAQPNPSSSGWKLPPQAIVDVLEAPPPPSVDLSPDTRWMLLVERPAMPGLDDVLRPWVGLAGERIDSATSAAYTVGFSTGIVLRSVETGAEQRIVTPAGARIGAISWSHDSRHIAFTVRGDSGVDVWGASIDAPRAKRIAGPLASALDTGFDWMPDGERLLVWLRAGDRGPQPERGRVPSGPSTQESAGASTPVRTWQDLLKSPHDEALFAWHIRAQLAIASSDGALRNVGAPGLYTDASVSPDGAHVLVTRLERPFAYTLPWNYFPQTIEVWSASGALEHVVARVPAGDAIPQEGVRTGPRNVHWHASRDATLVWADALDGGDPKQKAEFRDRWMSADAPFTQPARELLKLQHRAQGITYLADPERVLASDYDRDRKWRRTRLFDLAKPAAPLATLDDRSVNDRYGDPGAPVSVTTARGTRVLRQDGDFIYRSGAGATKQGARPFLDRHDLAGGTTERLWRCGEQVYESAVAIASSSATAKPTVIHVRETPTEPPKWSVLDLNSGTARTIHAIADPQPLVRGIKKELITYKRADGVDLSATLYLPPGYVAGTRLPVFVWAYPLEFTDASTAGQVGTTPYRFTQLRGPSQLLLALHGYAVLDDAAMPIIGDPETVNDTFLSQLALDAQAAIDELDKRGVCDRARVGVGGHSYGAFMTANLLAHTDLFRAGIARSGAYNRTLTPFGFQSERRTIWEAPKAYLELSPFLAAQKIDEPLLLVHGEKDSNMGTFPIQSERLFQAVQGNKGHARLVMLPGEDHGYRARESVLHVTAEMFEWMDEHVRGAQPRAVRAEAPAPIEAAAAR